ncbi:MAG: MBOAT family protein [Deltaproteobacteria bacterium]|nr:MBOAT family protein [Deltaproteobacteria bacterium]
MLFTSPEFALFFLVVIAINWWIRGRRGLYKAFLLIVNGIFYGSLEMRFLPLLLAVGVTNWGTAHLLNRPISQSWRKFILAVDVSFNLGLLAFFKYSEFFFSTLESTLLFLGSQARLPMAEITFPVGISFFTFQGLSYAIDVYRDRRQLVPSLTDVLVYVSFFPTVLSGPIMRARHFIPQLFRRTYDRRSFQIGFGLILMGLFKKIVIASYVSEHIVRQVFQVPSQYSSCTVLAGVYAYSIQIYCDFSGYSDLAIGLALLLGFQVMDNFRQPYVATDLRDFWRRWHISLSTWLRDYLYIPLGGNQKGEIRKHVNLILTMGLGGLWHGAHARFILWGILHGIGLVINHLWRDHWNKRRKTSQDELSINPWVQRLKQAAAWFLTFNFVSFLWVFFRAEDAGRAWEIFTAIFRIFQPGAGFELMVIPATMMGLALQVWERQAHEGYLRMQNRLPLPLQGLTIALFCIIILKLGPDGVLPFIYFQF